MLLMVGEEKANRSVDRHIESLPIIRKEEIDIAITRLENQSALNETTETTTINREIPNIKGANTRKKKESTETKSTRG